MPHISDILCTDIPCLQGQVAAGENFAAVGDESDARSGQATLGHGIHGMSPLAVWVSAGLATRVPARMPIAGMFLTMLAVRTLAADSF